jgi:hypothetical protein
MLEIKAKDLRVGDTFTADEGENWCTVVGLETSNGGSIVHITFNFEGDSGPPFEEISHRSDLTVVVK